jgi:hypothetical protein
MGLFKTPDCTEGYGLVFEPGDSLSYRFPAQETKKLSQHIRAYPPKHACLNERIKIDIYNGDLSSKRWERTDWLIIQTLTDIKNMTVYAYNELKWSKRLMQLAIATIVPSTLFFTLNNFSEGFNGLDPLIKLAGVAVLGGVALLGAHPVTEHWRTQSAARAVEVTKLPTEDILKNWSNLAN